MISRSTTPSPMFNRPGSPTSSQRQFDHSQILVRRLVTSPADRVSTLLSLASQRDSITDLAKQLWETPGAITILLSEIISVYPFVTSTFSSTSVSQPILSLVSESTVCNSICLFQTLAANKATQLPFIQANLPLYLNPFIHSTVQTRESESFRFAALGVIGNLARSESPEVMDYLLRNDFIPRCLRVIKFGQEVTKALAGFILQRLIKHPGGITSVKESRTKLKVLLEILNKVVADLMQTYSQRVSRNIVIAYEALLNDPECRHEAAQRLTDEIMRSPLSTNYDQTFVQFVTRLKSLSAQK